MRELLIGAYKSRTMWAASVLAIGAELAPVLTPDTLALFGLHGPTLQRMGAVYFVVMALCRAITKQSLVQKGTDSDSPKPQPPETKP